MSSINTEHLTQYQKGILKDLSHLPWKAHPYMKNVFLLCKGEDVKDGFIFIYPNDIEYYDTRLNEKLAYPGVYSHIQVSEIEQIYKLETSLSNFI